MHRAHLADCFALSSFYKCSGLKNDPHINFHSSFRQVFCFYFEFNDLSYSRGGGGVRTEVCGAVIGSLNGLLPIRKLAKLCYKSV